MSIASVNVVLVTLLYVGIADVLLMLAVGGLASLESADWEDGMKGAFGMLVVHTVLVALVWLGFFIYKLGLGG